MRNRFKVAFAIAVLFSLIAFTVNAQDAKFKALIIEGQNNHKNWPETTVMMKSYLEESGLFEVDVVRTKPKGTDPEFKPDFSKYNVLVSNYNGASWPEETQKSFVNYIENGGGLVVIHAADNAFGKWKEYNEMIGLGGWGGRNERSGPYIYFDADGKQIKDTSKGGGGHHGPQHEFSVVVRDDSHPITQGLPTEWLHAKDELYDKLRGPGENMKVLATAFADKNKGGTGRHEPMMMTIRYGEGRVFHTPMGHGNYSQECVGFITVLQRGAEWAASGKVTVKVPDDFPTPDKSSSRKFNSNPQLAAFKKRVDEILKILQGDDGEAAIRAIAAPKDVEKLFDGSSPEELQKVFDKFITLKAPRLVELLKSLDYSKAKFNDDGSVEFDTDGRDLRFEFTDGNWYIRN